MSEPLGWHDPYDMEYRTDDLRSCEGKLQRKWEIHTYTDAGGFRPLRVRFDWRDIPEVTA